MNTLQEGQQRLESQFQTVNSKLDALFATLQGKESSPGRQEFAAPQEAEVPRPSFALGSNLREFQVEYKALEARLKSVQLSPSLYFAKGKNGIKGAEQTKLSTLLDQAAGYVETILKRVGQADDSEIDSGLRADIELSSVCLLKFLKDKKDSAFVTGNFDQRTSSIFSGLRDNHLLDQESLRILQVSADLSGRYEVANDQRSAGARFRGFRGSGWRGSAFRSTTGYWGSRGASSRGQDFYRRTIEDASRSGQAGPGPSAYSDQ